MSGFLKSIKLMIARASIGTVTQHNAALIEQAIHAFSRSPGFPIFLTR
jgi:hypothetical protein